MKQVIILGMTMIVLNVNAATDNDNNQTQSVTAQQNGQELLAEVSQPAEDATNIKVIVMKNQTIEEYRQKGELVLVKVIPNEGVPYYIDPMERDKLKGMGLEVMNSGVRPVRWVLKEF
jgi:uncharacterized membrane protein